MPLPRWHPVPLRVGGSVSNTWIVLEVVWGSTNEAQNEGVAPQHIGHRADVEAGQAQVAGRVIEHGHSSLLHVDLRSQANGLKRAEIHQGHLLLQTAVYWRLGAGQTQGAVEEESRESKTHQVMTMSARGPWSAKSHSPSKSVGQSGSQLSSGAASSRWAGGISEPTCSENYLKMSKFY
jgi:hypothetical protein